jgi:hypothetical protein
MAWQADLRGMLGAGTKVHACCSKCRAWKPVDVQALAELKGLDYSLWGKVSHCRTEGCDGLVFYHGDVGGMSRPLRG